MFKIRNKQTGLFSTGGYSPGWTKKGKVWNSRGPAILSLLCYSDINRISIENLEVVEFETIEKTAWSAVELTRESKERTAEKIRKSAEFTARYNRQRDEKAYEELRARLGK
jgi:hypothetical protein